MAEQHRMGSTAERMPTEVYGVPVAPEVQRHNAYVAGFEDGATDAFGWDDYGHGMRVGGLDYRAGFTAGKAARKAAFEEARRRRGAKVTRGR